MITFSPILIEKKFLNFDGLVKHKNNNKPVFELLFTDNVIFAVDFDTEQQAEEKYFDSNLSHLNKYLGISLVTEDAYLNIDASNKKESSDKGRLYVRDKNGRFAKTGSTGDNTFTTGNKVKTTDEVIAPKKITTKTNLAQLRAIAKQEGIEFPTKAANKRSTWIEAIKAKTGDTYTAKTRKKKDEFLDDINKQIETIKSKDKKNKPENVNTLQKRLDEAIKKSDKAKKGTKDDDSVISEKNYKNIVNKSVNAKITKNGRLILEDSQGKLEVEKDVVDDVIKAIRNKENTSIDRIFDAKTENYLQVKVRPPNENNPGGLIDFRVGRGYKDERGIENISQSAFSFKTGEKILGVETTKINKKTLIDKDLDLSKSNNQQSKPAITKIPDSLVSIQESKINTYVKEGRIKVGDTDFDETKALKSAENIKAEINKRLGNNFEDDVQAALYRAAYSPEIKEGKKLNASQLKDQILWFNDADKGIWIKGGKNNTITGTISKELNDDLKLAFGYNIQQTLKNASPEELAKMIKSNDNPILRKFLTIDDVKPQPFNIGTSSTTPTVKQNSKSSTTKNKKDDVEDLSKPFITPSVKNNKNILSEEGNLISTYTDIPVSKRRIGSQEDKQISSLKDNERNYNPGIVIEKNTGGDVKIVPIADNYSQSLNASGTYHNKKMFNVVVPDEPQQIALAKTLRSVPDDNSKGIFTAKQPTSTLTDVGIMQANTASDLNSTRKGHSASDDTVEKAAIELRKAGGKNWVPVLVRKSEFDTYDVVGNYFAYDVAKKANIDKIWTVEVP